MEGGDPQKPHKGPIRNPLSPRCTALRGHHSNLFVETLCCSSQQLPVADETKSFISPPRLSLACKFLELPCGCFWQATRLGSCGGLERFSKPGRLWQLAVSCCVLCTGFLVEGQCLDELVLDHSPGPLNVGRGPLDDGRLANRLAVSQQPAEQDSTETAEPRPGC